MVRLQSLNLDIASISRAERLRLIKLGRCCCCNQRNLHENEKLFPTQQSLVEYLQTAICPECQTQTIVSDENDS